MGLPRTDQLGAPAVAQRKAGGSSAGPFLYVAGARVSMYTLGSSVPLHSVRGYGGRAIALDAHGNLCEANGNVSFPQIYAFNARTLQLEGTLGGEGFGTLVADRAGYLYGTNGGARTFVYAPGCTHQVGTIRHCQCWPLVFDRSGNLYGGAGGEVRIFAPTQERWHMKFVRAINEGIDNAVALAIGPSGDLFVSNDGDWSITVFKPGGSKPTRRITKGLDYPGPLAVDSKGRLYVASEPDSPPSVHGWVTVYAPGGTRPIRKITFGERVAASAFAIDSSDNLYVAADNSVRVYSPGGVKLLRRITKGVADPEALLIGSP